MPYAPSGSNGNRGRIIIYKVIKRILNSGNACYQLVQIVFDLLFLKIKNKNRLYIGYWWGSQKEGDH
jgi:hypothetical protein